MFESLALENPRSTARNWTTIASFTLQAAGLALLVLAPIGYTQAVAPRFAEHLVTPLGMTNVDTGPTAVNERHPNAAPVPYHETTAIYVGAGHNLHPHANAGPSTQPFDPNLPYVPGGGLVQRGDGFPNWLLDGARPVVNPAPPTLTHAKPYPVSHLALGMLIRQVQPVYPAMAKATRTQGKVLLAAVIDSNGRITRLRVLAGHPLLIPAAIDAVRQWRYRPYILNGQPVEVETQITVNFTLQQN
ncbi:MAG: energy transducer TonB [Terriglobia bacterium]|nr:energy transducer TonB [Terriglobia bacterium]